MSKPPAPPYIPAKHTGGRQHRIDRIVIHGTVSNTECGGALAIESAPGRGTIVRFTLTMPPPREAEAQVL